jgi:hypothetical protein
MAAILDVWQGHWTQFWKRKNEKYHIKDWYHYDQWFLRRRSKCEKLTDD